MGFYTAVLVWLMMGAVLAAGIVMAVKGSLWLFVVGLVLFLAAFAKFGCATH